MTYNPQTDASANILDNAGLEIWQRGTSFSNPGNAVYTADRWTASYSGAPTVTYSQDSSAGNVDTGSFSMKVNITAVGGATVLALRQQTENFLAYANGTIALSARVKTSMSGVSLVVIGTNPVSATTHPGDGNWHTLYAVGTVPASPTQLGASIGFVGATVTTGIMWIDSVMMNVGGNPATFVPLTPEIDLARCQRYFTITTSGVYGVAQAGGANGYFFWKYPTSMRAAPTLVFSSISLVVINAGSTTMASPAVNTNTVDGTIWGGTFAATLGATGNPCYTSGGSITASSDL